LVKNDALVDRIESGYESAGLSDKAVVMLRYTEKLTRTPDRMTKGDVEMLRSSGWSDADVLAIAEVTAYYAYVNRIADGLGVDVETWFSPD
jgi:uncharacterized peroxidase-related enzyme